MRASMRRDFMLLVLAWFEEHKPSNEPVSSPGLFSNDPTYRSFPGTMIPRSDLEAMFLKAYGRKATRGFNGKGDIESALAGIHDGDLKTGKTELKVYEEGVRFYLGTGRNPMMHWSSVIDREGGAIWQPKGGYAPGTKVSTRYPWPAEKKGD